MTTTPTLTVQLARYRQFAGTLLGLIRNECAAIGLEPPTAAEFDESLALLLEPSLAPGAEFESPERRCAAAFAVTPGVVRGLGGQVVQIATRRVRARAVVLAAG